MDRLVWNAVPTKFDGLSRPPQQLGSSRNPQQRSIPAASTSAVCSDLIYIYDYIVVFFVPLCKRKSALINLFRMHTLFAGCFCGKTCSSGPACWDLSFTRRCSEDSRNTQKDCSQEESEKIKSRLCQKEKDSAEYPRTSSLQTAMYKISITLFIRKCFEVF